MSSRCTRSSPDICSPPGASSPSLTTYLTLFTPLVPHPHTYQGFKETLTPIACLTRKLAGKEKHWFWVPRRVAPRFGGTIPASPSAGRKTLWQVRRWQRAPPPLPNSELIGLWPPWAPGAESNKGAKDSTSQCGFPSESGRGSDPWGPTRSSQGVLAEGRAPRG